MKIAIVGAGFTGLAAAWELTKAGAEVTVFESQPVAGGLAAGFKDKQWQWYLDNHYHHVFSTDRDIQGFVTELGLSDLLFYQDTKTATLYQGKAQRLDSPISLLKFSKISLWSRLRTGMVLAALKFNPYGRFLERFTAAEFLQKTMGEESWKVLWQPLFASKFGQYKDQVNAAWFWARIFARSKQLGYFKGGFAHLVNQIVAVLKAKGVIFRFNHQVFKTDSINQSIQVNYRLIGSGSWKSGKQKSAIFDKVLFTINAHLLVDLLKQLENDDVKKLKSFKGLGAQTLILQLNKKFFVDQNYWLNINEKDWPFLAAVEHTNFINKAYYNNKYLLYVGKYLDIDQPEFSYDKNFLHELYSPYLEKLSPGYQRHLEKSWLFKEEFAQPVPFVNQSQQVPSICLPINHCYWASMQHVYPWDRGTNYAVMIGKKAAREILKDTF